MSRNNVVCLDELKMELQASKPAVISDISAGFSKRFNFFIDISEVDVPTAGDGRYGYFEGLGKWSKPSVYGWLAKNKPPKETTLFQIVEFFLKHIDGGDYISPKRVVSWLRYGDEVVPCPFMQDAIPEQHKLIPLAVKIIADVAKKMGVSAREYDLKKVIDLSIVALADFDVRDLESVEDVHRLIIKEYIRSSLA